MGGLGSGNWYRWDKKRTTEEVNRVDIRYMKKRRLLRPGNSGSLSWSCGEEQTGSVRYQVNNNYLRLIYRTRTYGDDWQEMDEKIWFQRTSCNYGGQRLWFSCPHCHSRVAIIYGNGMRFLCRHCYGLPYASQGETSLDRLARKIRKIRTRLDVDIDLDFPIYMKPKGMHWKTFDKLVRLERVLNAKYSAAFEEKMAMFSRLGLF